MKPGPNPRRSRSRNGKRFQSVRNQTFESNGPDVKIRGSAQQVLDKYLALAQDASSSGDRVTAEAYLQHAEHYFRILHLEGENGAANGNQARANQPARTPESVGEGPTDDNDDVEPTSAEPTKTEAGAVVAEQAEENLADTQPAA